jgi:hypothetical protein
MSVQEIRRAAIARVQARRPAPQYRTAPTPDGRTIRYQLDTPDRTRAATGAEWWDDRLAAMPPVANPAGVAAFGIAEAARDGAEAGVAAVGQARSLGHADQFLVYATIGDWGSRDPVPEAQATLAAIRREWGRLHLATTPPEIQETDIDWSRYRRAG